VGVCVIIIITLLLQWAGEELKKNEKISKDREWLYTTNMCIHNKYAREKKIKKKIKKKK